MFSLPRKFITPTKGQSRISSNIKVDGVDGEEEEEKSEAKYWRTIPSICDTDLHNFMILVTMVMNDCSI